MGTFECLQCPDLNRTSNILRMMHPRPGHGPPPLGRRPYAADASAGGVPPRNLSWQPPYSWMESQPEGQKAWQRHWQKGWLDKVGATHPPRVLVSARKSCWWKKPVALPGCGGALGLKQGGGGIFARTSTKKIVLRYAQRTKKTTFLGTKICCGEKAVTFVKSSNQHLLGLKQVSSRKNKEPANHMKLKF